MLPQTGLDARNHVFPGKRNGKDAMTPDGEGWHLKSFEKYLGFSMGSASVPGRQGWQRLFQKRAL
jgi:hypothetical protein